MAYYNYGSNGYLPWSDQHGGSHPTKEQALLASSSVPSSSSKNFLTDESSSSSFSTPYTQSSTSSSTSSTSSSTSLSTNAHIDWNGLPWPFGYGVQGKCRTESCKNYRANGSGYCANCSDFTGEKRCKGYFCRMLIYDKDYCYEHECVAEGCKNGREINDLQQPLDYCKQCFDLQQQEKQQEKQQEEGEDDYIDIACAPNCTCKYTKSQLSSIRLLQAKMGKTNDLDELRKLQNEINIIRNK